MEQFAPAQEVVTHTLLEQVEDSRLIATEVLDQNKRSEMGQFMTPPPVACLMATMFHDLTGDIRLLDAGAGVGSLTAAFVDEACNREEKPNSLTTYAYELEERLIPYLRATKDLCTKTCLISNVPFDGHVFQRDFITQSSTLFNTDLFSQPQRFNRAILNPPYTKINSDSCTRKQLSQVGIEVSNLYAAFVALTIHLLEDNGELVAITPRSFCNGPYFKPFRQLLLSNMTIDKIHIFHSRNKAFKGDAVLQENIIFHAVKNKTKHGVIISSSACAEDTNVVTHKIKQETLVNPNDPDLFIHIPTTKEEDRVAVRARSLPHSLAEIGLQVSTGRVVDFRASEYLQTEVVQTSVPLIYPANFKEGFIEWPKLSSRKPIALEDCKATANLMVPNGTYTLVKRFTSKEERRRVVAAIYCFKKIKAKRVGFENHVNYFHRNGKSLPLNLAKGLTIFLNSSLVDQYFRQFNGHTQVNATDLRSLRYPSLQHLKQMGNRFKTILPGQQKIDSIVEETLFS